MAETLGNWHNGSPVITLDNVPGDFSGWSNGAPVVKKPKKHARFDVAGLAGTGAIGDVTVHINVTAAVSGLGATGAIGTVTVTTTSTQPPGPGPGSGIGWRVFWDLPERVAEIIHARFIVHGLEAKGTVGDAIVRTDGRLTASGIDARVRLGSTIARCAVRVRIKADPTRAQIGPVGVRTIHNPSDEDMLVWFAL